MFSGEIYYYWPINSVEKSLVKHRFSLHNLLAVMYSRNIPMTEKWKYVVFFISNNYYKYLKRYFEIFVSNDCLSIFWRSAALRFNYVISARIDPVISFTPFLRMTSSYITWVTTSNKRHLRNIIITASI